MSTPPGVRCPWCTTRIREDAPSCPHCGCARIDASDYGVARVLRAAGVDRISLRERIQALDAETRETVEAEWDAQRELVRALREDGERAAAALPARERLLALLDDELARCIPIAPGHAAALRFGPTRPSRDDDDGERAWLDAVRGAHPSMCVRQLAALALAERGAWSRELRAELRAMCHARDPCGAVAALTLCGWRADARGVEVQGRTDEVRVALEDALALPELEERAAVAMVYQGVRPRGALEAPLRRAARSDDVELRFAAALTLGEEALLLPFLHDADAARRQEARRALGALGSLALVPLLSPAEDAPLPPNEEQRALLASLRAPLPPPLREAVMRLAVEGSGELAREALRVLTRGSFAERPHEDQEAMAAFAGRAGPALGAERALELLAWALSHDPRVPATPARGFVDGVRGALAGPLPSAALVRTQAFAVFLEALDAEDVDALDALVRAPPAEHAYDDVAVATLGAVFDLHARREGRAPRVPLGAWLARWWGLSPRPIGALAGALADRRGTRRLEELVRWFWLRFVEHPEERRDVIEAVRPCLSLLVELRDATPASERPGGGDPVLTWEIWAHADPENMWRLVDELREQVTDAQLARFFERVVERAEQVVHERPRTAIVSVFRASAEIANRYRAQDESDALEAAAAALEARVPSFAERFARAQPLSDSERGAEHFLEDIATERRLIAETAARRREAREQELERERQRREREEHERRAREAAAREAERQERERLDAVAALQASRVGATPTAPAPVTLRLPQPAFAREPIDDEPYVAGPGPRTLLEYAQLLKAMQAGVDVLTLLAVWQLDVASWGACAARWGEVMTRDGEAAQRFAALLMARWD